MPDKKTDNLRVNNTLGHYRIIRKLGAGGMGEIYLAEDTRLDRQVALKFLPAEFAADNDRMRRFVREAKSASALNHPNIITIYEINEFENTHFIATEYIAGETLDQHLKSSDFSLKSVLEIAIQIASALQTAHSANIIHRDIKPDNVMIRQDGLIKILDFGIAKLSEAAPGNVSSEDSTAIKPQKATLPGTIIGTANYMSPEQAKGKEVDARTDIFSFGVVLYEMLAGHLPFEGETAMETIAAIINKEPIPLDKQKVPSEIERIIGQSLQKDKNERYQTIKELLADLKEVKQELEFQDKLEKTVEPVREEPKTQILKATTAENKNDSISIRKSGFGKLAIGASLALLISAIGLGYWYFASNNSKQIESIAVMPFANESGNPENEYLSDGIAESLTNSLSQLPNLKVASRNSAFRYKGKQTENQTIGKELNVRAILNGEVKQVGDQLVINVRLDDASDGHQIWGEQYDRKLADILAVQRDIAQEVTNNLRLKLSNAEEQQLKKSYTENAEAYQLFLKGNFYAGQYTKDGLAKGIDYYNRAIAADPNFALAYNGIAYYYIVQADWYQPAGEAMPKAREAAVQALRIDPNLAETHSSLGAVAYWYDWDWTTAEKEFRRAIELDPRNSRVRAYYSAFLAAMGRGDESVEQAKEGEKLEPGSAEVSTFVGATLVFSRRFDEAIDQQHKAVGFDPDNWYARNWLGRAYAGKGEFDKAIEEYKKATQLQEGLPEVLANLGYAYAQSGNKAEAQKVLDQLNKLSAERYVPPYEIAVIYTGLGNKDQAFQWLEKAYRDKCASIPWLKSDPQMDSLRSDPRFRDLLNRVGLSN